MEPKLVTRVNWGKYAAAGCNEVLHMRFDPQCICLDDYYLVVRDYLDSLSRVDSFGKMLEFGMVCTMCNRKYGTIY